MIEFRSVSFTYPNSQVGIHNVSFAVNTGELLAVLGKSGCGKTTMLKLLAGFEQPHQGEIWINGQNQHGLPCAARHLGIVFQDYALFPHYTVMQNVIYPLSIKKIADAPAKAQEMITLVGLSGMERHYPHQLSGGQKQRVALARALVFKPAALLLDEPLSALDASLREEMRTEIVNIQKKLNITTFLITHDQEEAMTMADQVAVMENGRITQCAPPEILYRQPQSLSVANFVGKANIVTGQVVDATTIKTAIGIIHTSAHPFAPDTSVHLVIRPERISATPAMTDDNLFPIHTILAQRFLGATTAYQVQIESLIMDLEIAHLTSPLTHISIPKASIHVLNGASS